MNLSAPGPGHAICVFLADDNLIVREGVRALIERHTDLRVVGVAADYAELVAGAAATGPHVLVTDIRMPPSFQREGIDAAKEVRKRHPGTGVVVLSQYDDPEYAVSLLAEGSTGYGYLLKDRIAEGSQLADAIRCVAIGGTALDPAIVEALVRPVIAPGGLPPAEEGLLGTVAEGKPVKAKVEALFVKLATGVSTGDAGALRRLRMLHQAIVDREEQGETLSRLLADKLRKDARPIGETERLVVTILMSDIRSYSAIAERADPSQLAGQLNTHRAAMNRAVLGEGGTVMQFVGDAVMAVFGAPVPAARSRRPGRGHSDARPAGRNQRPVDHRQPGRVRHGTWPVHGRGRDRLARVGRNGLSTRWSPTPSTFPSDSSSSPRLARP
jgi:adenylate cyclase